MRYVHSVEEDHESRTAKSAEGLGQPDRPAVEQQQPPPNQHSAALARACRLCRSSSSSGFPQTTGFLAGKGARSDPYIVGTYLPLS